jgi:hypothetical protein
MPSSKPTQGHSPTTSALALATVLGDMLLQAGDGHRHPHRQLPLFGGLQLAEPNQAPHPIARLDELAFEPSMFRTTYRQTRSRIHPAPVENREPQIIIKANKKQTLFLPFVRHEPPCTPCLLRRFAWCSWSKPGANASCVPSGRNPSHIIAQRFRISAWTVPPRGII